MIKLTGEQITKLHNNQYAMNPSIVEGFEGWYIEADKDSGEYFKSYMIDLEVLLYDNNDMLRGIAIGGAYAQDEYHFDETLEFEEVEPETELTKFNNYLKEVADKAIKASSEIAQMEAKLKLIADFITGLKLEQGTKEY